ncbi:MAG: hypothetical protein ABIR30_00345 [Chitinophagaceae bacterium]
MSPTKKSPGAEGKNQTAEKKQRSKGKTPKQIMTRHIKDKDDVITEEEFKGMDIGTGLSNDTSHEPIELPKGHNRPKDEDKDPVITTPWDVIK